MSDLPLALREPRSTRTGWTIVWLVLLVVALFVIRIYPVQAFSIPSGSMQPTLMIGDYFATDKSRWGIGAHSLQLPLPIEGRLLETGTPNPGDVAVFFNEPTGEDYVKRIIGLPGDKILMVQGRLYINDVMVPRQLIGPAIDTNSDGNATAVIQYRETLPNGVSYVIQEISDDQMLDNAGPYRVPPGHYFMMGDNRDRSADSRVLSQVGYVPAGDLIGRGTVKFMSKAPGQMLPVFNFEPVAPGGAS